ncbi:exp1-like protein, partial [Ceratobasidium sp. 370]
MVPEDFSEEDIPPAPQRSVLKPPRPRPQDPDAPKKPLSAQLLFLQWVRADQIRANEVFGDETDTTRQPVLAAVRWGTLSDPEKKPFLEQAEREMTNYDAARKDYEERASAQKARRWRRINLSSKLRGFARSQKENVARSRPPGFPSGPIRGDPGSTSSSSERPFNPEEWSHPWDAT